MISGVCNKQFTAFERECCLYAMGGVDPSDRIRLKPAPRAIPVRVSDETSRTEEERSSAEKHDSNTSSEYLPDGRNAGYRATENDEELASPHQSRAESCLEQKPRTGVTKKSPVRDQHVRQDLEWRESLENR